MRVFLEACLAIPCAFATVHLCWRFPVHSLLFVCNRQVPVHSPLCNCAGLFPLHSLCTSVRGCPGCNGPNMYRPGCSLYPHPCAPLHTSSHLTHTRTQVHPTKGTRFFSEVSYAQSPLRQTRALTCTRVHANTHTQGDPRAVLALPLDCRVHFALVCGAKSCPPIRYVQRVLAGGAH